MSEIHDDLVLCVSGSQALSKQRCCEGAVRLIEVLSGVAKKITPPELWMSFLMEKRTQTVFLANPLAGAIITEF